MLIGLVGRKQSGKSTLAKHFEERFNFVRIRFAGPLKDMMRALGLNDEEIEGNRKEIPCELLGGETPRFAMQTLGTEWGREMIHPDLWVNAWEKQYRVTDSFGHDVIVDDVRFPNEVSTILRNNGRLIKIVRPGLEKDGFDTHASEQLDCDAHWTVFNTGTIDAMCRQVEEILGL